MISVFDYSFLDQFYSFYHNSILPLNITNFIAFALDHRTYSTLQEWGIPSILFELDTNDNTSISSDFDESSFSNKVNMKTMAVLHVLRSGYNVLLTDVDVVLFKNPFDFFTCHCCDIHIQRDELSIKSHDRNSGFVYVKNTPRSLELFDLAWHYYEENRMIRQQPALNKAIDVLLKKQLRIQLLPLKFFVPGFLFFETLHFNQLKSLPCKECVMFHNNWIVSAEAKEYRLKELGLFYSPHDDYSDETVNYLTYEPLGLEATIEEEQSLLETALRLSIALDRVLILPSFSVIMFFCPTGVR
ncbi:hypothetical protein WA588_003469 [Blastocystis sp. NMH]